MFPIINIADASDKNGFDIQKCLVKPRAADFFDCLAIDQAGECGHSIPFGYGFFCKHPCRLEFLQNRTPKEQSCSSQV